MSHHHPVCPVERPRERTDPRPPPLNVCVGICPRCGGPMTARCGRAGPYFHCLCYERPSRDHRLRFSDPDR